MSELLDRARELRAMIESLAVNMTDDEAMEAHELLPKWSDSKDYVVGDRFSYDGVVYRVLQNHTALPTWRPGSAPSLYAEVLPGQAGTEIGEWVQPDSTNPYMTGDKVTFEGKTYESVIDNNVWSPSAYPAGWKEITE